jgi:large subunit ribosomal protein L15
MRLGRGPGSGKGKTSGKGHKGSMARAGHGGPGGGKPGFEGGQMPLTRRIPKRGFTNPFRQEAQVVRLSDLAKVEGDVTAASLGEAGVIDPKRPAKLLANGELTSAVTVRGIKVSAGARQKIEAAGGRVEE